MALCLVKKNTRTKLILYANNKKTLQKKEKKGDISPHSLAVNYRQYPHWWKRGLGQLKDSENELIKSVTKKKLN